MKKGWGCSSVCRSWVQSLVSPLLREKLEEAAMAWIWNILKASCVEGWVLTAAMFRDWTFGRWQEKEGMNLTGYESTGRFIISCDIGRWKEFGKQSLLNRVSHWDSALVPSPFLSLSPVCFTVLWYFRLTSGPEWRSQVIMDWSLWNCELKINLSSCIITSVLPQQRKAE